MYPLKKSFRYYAYIFMMCISMGIFALPFFISTHIHTEKKNIFFVICLCAGSIFIVYYLIDLIKKIAAVRYSDAGIYIDKNFCTWQDITGIEINYNAYIRQISTTATIIHTKDAAFTIYNFAYRNYPELMQYIQTFHPDLLPANNALLTRPVNSSLYKTYYSLSPWALNVMTFFGIGFLSAIILKLFLAGKNGAVALFAIQVLPVLILCIYSLNKIQIEGDCFIIKKVLLPIKKTFLLSEISMIKYFYRSQGRGQTKWIAIILKDFTEHNFFIDHITNKKLYELKQDLNSLDINVADTIFVDPLQPFKANYKSRFTFNLRNKKKPTNL